MKRKAEVLEEREMKIRLRKEGFHWSDFGFIFYRFGKLCVGWEMKVVLIPEIKSF